MMDSEGQWEYVVDKVRMCARAMWPRYPEVFMILCRWQTVNCAAWALREGRPYPRSEGGRWRAVRGRLRTEETAERSARQICPSRVSSWESVKRPSWRVKCFPMRSPRMTLILRDCVSGEVERAVMRMLWYV